jgi:hypothetical protein
MLRAAWALRWRMWVELWPPPMRLSVRTRWLGPSLRQQQQQEQEEVVEAEAHGGDWRAPSIGAQLAAAAGGGARTRGGGGGVWVVAAARGGPPPPPPPRRCRRVWLALSLAWVGYCALLLPTLGLLIQHGVPPPEHHDHDQKAGLTEIYYIFENRSA